MRQTKAKLLRKFSKDRKHYRKLKKAYLHLNSAERRQITLYIEGRLEKEKTY